MVMKGMLPMLFIELSFMFLDQWQHPKVRLIWLELFQWHSSRDWPLLLPKVILVYPDQSAAQVQCIGSACAVQRFYALHDLWSAYAATTLQPNQYTYFIWSAICCKWSEMYFKGECNALESEVHCASREAYHWSAPKCALRCTGNMLHFDLGICRIGIFTLGIWLEAYNKLTLSL